MDFEDCKHILIVDDEEGDRAVLKNILKAHKPDYHITAARDAFIALGRLFQQSFDLIITDYQMPEMNGLELAEVIQYISPSTQILLMSGEIPQIDEVTGCLELAGYIEKPFTPMQIMARVDQIMAQI
jgi:CheY-like chemotaxis protein